MKHRPLPLALLGGALVLAACTDRGEAPLTPSAPDASARPADGAGAAGVRHLPGRLVVRFRPGARGQERAVAAAQGAALRERLRLDRTWVLSVPEGQEERIAVALSRNPSVEFAEPDYLYEVVPCETGECAAPNDPFVGYKWDLHNDGSISNSQGAFIQATGAADADIDWLEAFDALGADFAGSAVIAILDTGIRDTHLDLAGRVIAARNFAVGYPADFVEDRHGHGTHVAGIAAARGNDGSVSEAGPLGGVAGVAYGAGIRLINAKTCEFYRFPDGSVSASCPTSSQAEAIVWAVDGGADVLNLSLGSPGWATTGSAAVQAALQYARASGVLPFCASGNENWPGAGFPARFPECVAVGATSWSDGRAGYSNYAPEVELSAPGGGANAGGTAYSYVLSLSHTGDDAYSFKSGTSMAAPQAAGLAALLLASGMSDADAVLARMKATADDLGPAGPDPEFGAGRINACRALDPARIAVAMPDAISLNDGGSALIPVTLFSGARFHASMFDVADVTLGDGSGAEAHVAVRGPGYRAALEDADGDGVPDLTLMFPRSAVVANGDLTPSTTSLVVGGSVGCRRVGGSQAVKVVG